MLSSSDMASLRATANTFLPDSAQVVRKSAAADGLGGFSDSWANQGAAVSCRLKLLRGQPIEGMIAQRAGGRQIWDLVLPANTDVTMADRVVVTLTFSTPASKTLEVISVQNGSWEVTRRCFCVEVK